MYSRKSYFTVIMIIAAALYLMVPACGNKNNNNTPVYPGWGNGTVCQPGQFCNGNYGGFGSGIALLPAPAVTSIDSRNSIAQLQFGGTNVIAGQVYNGPV